MTQDSLEVIQALHIIFVVTWFAGLFYIVRLFIYQREAQDVPERERAVLTEQFQLMVKVVVEITWPSAIITAILGPWFYFYDKWSRYLAEFPGCAAKKLSFCSSALFLLSSLPAI